MDLDEAWRWYTTTRSHLKSSARLGKKHWDGLPEDSPLWKDDAFKSLGSATIVEGADFSLQHLDDFGVMILFSVFESIVRDRVLAQIQAERKGVEETLLGGVIDASLVEWKRKGFSRLLEIFKGMDAALVEEVSQVRRYRNWVAHGRQSASPDAVDPELAYDRLGRFLDRMTRE